MTLRDIATLAGCCVQTLRRRIRPNDDPVSRESWARLLDLRIKDTGPHGLVHADAARVRQHLDRIRGRDTPLYAA
jgi:hypothetical protein